jgi:hypothetical protein
MTEQEHNGSVAMGDSNETGNPMALFSENVDRWGAAEWFDRLAKAIREQDKAVRAMYQLTGDDKDAHEITFETYRNIASSSAMHLIRDYEEQVRAALSPRPAHEPVGWLPTKTVEWLQDYEGSAVGRDTVAYRKPIKTDGGVPVYLAAPQPAHGTSATDPASIDEAWIGRFAAWNLHTFGPGMRTAGTVDHIRKECREIEANPTDPKEWVDIILLGINGLVRQGHTPAQIIAEIHGKHAVNEARTWPDWRNHPDSAIEHDRTQDAAAASEGSTDAV